MTQRPTVLVVEDDPQIREVVVMALADEGFAVLTAGSARAALAAAAATPPAAVVLDLMLPDLDGAEVATRLREQHGAQLPIVLVSASGRVAHVAKRLAIAAFLAKPFDLDLLVGLVRDTLAAAEAAPPNRPGAGSSPPSASRL